MEQPEPTTSEAPRERRRLQLKPRDEAAAAKAALDRASAKQSPFGDAKPREVALAGRAGKTEKEILAEELAKEKLQLRLTPDQTQEKRAAEASIAEAQSQLDEADDDGREAAASELKERQLKLDQLMQEFQTLAVQRAKSGEGIRPSERRRLAEEAQGLQAGPPGQFEGSQYGAPGGRQSFGGRGGFGGGQEGFAGARQAPPGQNNWAKGGSGGRFNGYAGDGQQGDAAYGSFGGKSPPTGQAFWGNSGGGRSGTGGPRGGRSQGFSDDSRQFATGHSDAGGLPGMEGDEEYVSAAPSSRQDRF